VGLFEYAVFAWAVFLIVLGLIFEAAGFGIFVVGRLDGFILIILGVTLFWGGWILSGARGFWCAAAAVLNMFDTASTVAFWAFEINPLIRTIGPTIFMIAKITSSLTIMLYAKLQPNPRKGGILLTLLFALIVGWNLGQHLVAYLGVKDYAYGILLGIILSFLASATVLYALFTSRRRTP
jgi:hypothetical protein